MAAGPWPPETRYSDGSARARPSFGATPAQSTFPTASVDTVEKQVFESWVLELGDTPGQFSRLLLGAPHLSRPVRPSGAGGPLSSPLCSLTGFMVRAGQLEGPGGSPRSLGGPIPLLLHAVRYVAAGAGACLFHSAPL